MNLPISHSQLDTTESNRAIAIIALVVNELKHTWIQT